MERLSDRFWSKRLYIADLAGRLEAMETGALALDPVAYRLVARRLKAALAGIPQSLLAAQAARRHSAVAEALEGRHFEDHGALAGAAGTRARQVAAPLLRRLGRRSR